jgi:hypothetical protein
MKFSFTKPKLCPIPAWRTFLRSTFCRYSLKLNEFDIPSFTVQNMQRIEDVKNTLFGKTDTLRSTNKAILRRDVEVSSPR